MIEYLKKDEFHNDMIEYLKRDEFNYYKENVFLTKDNVVGIGVDVHMKGRSWAVLNIDGEKTNVLKFIDMDKKNAKDILSFLSQYRRSTNVNIDGDPFTKKYIYGNLNNYD